MEKERLRNMLMSSLEDMYNMEALACLLEFLQGEIHILQYLAMHQTEEINPSLLSDVIHVSRPRITTSLATLRKKGLVEMEPSQTDRRRVTVRISPAGLAFIKEKRQVVERYFDILLTGLGEETSLELIRLIQLCTNIMEDKQV